MSAIALNSTAVAVIVGMATPATLALSISEYTGNPLLRPLGLTAAALNSVAAPSDEEVVQVELHLAPGKGTDDQAMDLAERIKKAFVAKGADAWVVILRDPAATQSFVLYRIKHYEFGPYSLPRSAQGVAPALAAFREVYGAPGEGDTGDDSGAAASH